MKFDFGSLNDTAFEADWPVTVPVPQDGGKVRKETLSVRFRLVAEDALLLHGEGLEPTKEGLRQVVVGFGKGETQPFTPELLDLMLARPYVRNALIRAYGDFALGNDPGKNS